jgi:hypothetical protein
VLLAVLVFLKPKARQGNAIVHTRSSAAAIPN